MRRVRKDRQPSAALVVAIVALIVALTGTAVAGVATISALSHKDKKQVKKIADKEIGKKAKNLTVANANKLGNKVAAAYLLSGTSGEGWHVVGTAGQPSFQNSWVDYNNGFAPAAFYRDPIGRVHLKGIVTGGTNNTVAFTLPAGYRPPENAAFAVAGGSGSPAVADVDVFSNGDVFIFNGTATPVGLDGVSFRGS